MADPNPPPQAQEARQPTNAVNQDELDWIVFAKRFEESEGFIPNPADTRARELYRWFTFGAIAEHLGDLDLPKPKPFKHFVISKP